MCTHVQKRRWLTWRRSIAMSHVPIMASSMGPNFSPIAACARVGPLSYQFHSATTFTVVGLLQSRIEALV